MGAEQRIVGGIAGLIATGQLGAGDTLPTQAQLAAFYKTQPNTVALALATLTQRGLLEPAEKGRLVVATQPRGYIL